MKYIVSKLWYLQARSLSIGLIALLMLSGCISGNVKSSSANIGAQKHSVELGIKSIYRESTTFVIPNIDTLITKDNSYGYGLYRVGQYDQSKPIVVVIHGASDTPSRTQKYLRAYQLRYNIFVYKYDYLRELNEIANDFRMQVKLLITPLENPRVIYNSFSYGHHVFMQSVLNEQEYVSHQTEKNIFYNADVVHAGSVIAGSRRAVHLGWAKIPHPLMIAIKNLFLNRMIKFAKTLTPGGKKAQYFIENHDVFTNVVNEVRGIRILGDKNDPANHDTGSTFSKLHNEYIKLSNTVVYVDHHANDAHSDILDGDSPYVSRMLRLIKDIENTST